MSKKSKDDEKAKLKAEEYAKLKAEKNEVVEVKPIPLHELNAMARKGAAKRAKAAK